ncbi:hypothetical protein fugu_013594 [Takifugu bimaculatus]|uniref:Uncharacterized protein n=1 Tax=Takifugu bimaculatus TaxID=433685 RepID=A0A4Z2C4X4_9TELE|nr:hypothetical protein fugu_013594 [Takifugu bimaculatus]
MAAKFRTRVPWFSLNCFSSFVYILVFTLTDSLEDAPSLMSNVTLFGDSNVTTNDTDDYAEPASTTPPPDYSSTLQPSLSSGPLPLSARLPAPATNVADICPCDEQRDMCDSNCCCDTACGDHVALFTGCSVTSVGGNKQLCSREVASYSLASTIDGYSTLQSSVQRESHTGVFCIQSQNGVDGLSHPSPALPTDDNFDSLFQQSTRFIFSSEENGGQVSTAEDPAFSGYRYGDVLGTREESGERGRLWLPAPSVSARCVDTNPAAFLMDQSSRCTRPVVLESDCSTLPTLNMDSYTSIQVLAVVPMEISSVILQSVEGTQTQLMMTAGKDLRPVLLNPSLCANVVLKVAYLMKYTPAGEIVSVALSLVIGFVHETALPLQQEFQIAFVQDEDEATVHYSGNPGYVIGLPLVSGTRTAEYPYAHKFLAQILGGIVISLNPRDTLSVLSSSENQDCLQDPHQRSPILFGVDFVSGCSLRMEEVANCSLVSQTMLSVLRGSNYPQYVASFGNSPLENPFDWLPVTSNFNPGETQSCSIPVSFQLEIQWTNYGSLVNPQAQLVSIKEVIQTNKSSLASLSGGSNILPITSSVSFVAVGAAASPGYRAMPTINAKLPADFFFPFV